VSSTIKPPSADRSWTRPRTCSGPRGIGVIETRGGVHHDERLRTNFPGWL
jgi:hypothetical protein